MSGSVAYDNPEPLSSVYINPKKITIPQFNARIGYYFKEHWAFSFGYDHMKYLFADKNEVFLSGTIDPGIDNTTHLSGTYNSEPITTNRKTFHYENSDGLNYIRLELTRTDHLIETGSNDQFVLSSNLAVATLRTISMSGYGISMHANLRLEFFRHVFIQSGLSGGFHHQVKVRTRPNDPSSFARHTYGYGEFNTVVGFFLYIRSSNGCDSCPVW